MERRTLSKGGGAYLLTETGWSTATRAALRDQGE